VREAPAEGEQRLPRVALEAVLADGVFDFPAGEGVLEFGRENR